MNATDTITLVAAVVPSLVAVAAMVMSAFHVKNANALASDVGDTLSDAVHVMGIMHGSVTEKLLAAAPLMPSLVTDASKLVADLPAAVQADIPTAAAAAVGMATEAAAATGSTSVAAVMTPIETVAAPLEAAAAPVLAEAAAAGAAASAVVSAVVPGPILAVAESALAAEVAKAI